MRGCGGKTELGSMVMESLGPEPHFMLLGKWRLVLVAAIQARWWGTWVEVVCQGVKQSPPRETFC